jgi:glycosyltransferase involved in cell wall biosynthesis
MKICIVAPVSRWRGGIHQYSVHLVNHLATRAEIEVISYKDLFPRWLYPGEIKRTTAEMAVSTAIVVHEILKYYSVVSSFRAAQIIVHSIRPQVVDIQWFVPQHGFVFIPLMFFLKYWYRSEAKVFLTVHNVQPHESRLLDRFLSRMAFRLSDRLLVHAEKLRDEAVEHFGQAPRKIAVIPHGICADAEVGYGRAEARAQLGIKERYVLLFFGYVRRYKGLGDLIEAFRIVAEKFDVALLVAGEFFTAVQPYQEQLRSAGLADRAYLFPRYISTEEVPIFFKAADLLVQPYVRFSGQSGVTQTAYLHSLPVIATDVGGLPELVIHGETGLIVQPGKPKELASAIEALLRAERKRRCLGINGKRLLETNLTWDRVIQTMLETYDEN